jgi:hypothetical protein
VGLQPILQKVKQLTAGSHSSCSTVHLLEIPPRGLEPLKGNQQTIINKGITKSQESVLSTSLDKILQEYPEIERIITAWPKLPEHTKVAIKALIQTHITAKK